MLALAHQGQQEKGERQWGQHYLKRADLHPDLRYGTAWEAIYGAGNDRVVITTTGFDFSCFHYLLSCFEPRKSGKMLLWDHYTAVDRLILEDGAPLPYQETTSTLLVNPDRIIFAVTPSVCSRYLAFSVQMLLEVFKSIPEATPGTDDDDVFADYAGMISLRHPLLTKGFCFVDGVNIPVAESEFDDIQNAYYNGWACSHYCSNVLAFATDGNIIRATSISSRLLHVQQDAKLFLQRRKVSLCAIKLIRVVLVVVQHNLPLVCSSWKNFIDDL
ncbi:hypothetical protein PPTG_07282 [Phytophthora nicotianae INRA-310]|uniref:Uncharacterized protein n=1 Tax=Phytophthora nicotianae (strain INRA-310) TaxID=761204 RepID=W2QQ46_PHYN3|nr:hypothetical protein PPTG_07282 [Phytophthora nicotianae INRA-310]ETN15081.1 hypothetical protein PPTG_07282 [Phytophthora nicotianae INRA-310]